MTEIYMECTIDAGHRIVGHKGKCSNLHGHTYKIEVRLEGPIDDTTPGFIVDFGDIKALLNEWDHKMLLWKHDPIEIDNELGFGVKRLDFNPTAELMAEWLAEEICDRFPAIAVADVTVWETPKSMASFVYHADDQ